MNIQINVDDHENDSDKCRINMTVKIDQETEDLKEFIKSSGFRASGIARKAIKLAFQEAQKQIVAKRARETSEQTQSVA